MFAQAFYAVWEEGQSGEKARINAASAGLDQQTLFFLARQGAYLTPVPLPGSPADVAPGPSPVNLAYYRLPNGLTVLSRSKCSPGQHRRGRGDCFTHFILHRQPTAFLEALFPLYAWEAPFWQESPLPTRQELPLLPHLKGNEASALPAMMRVLADPSREPHLPNFFSAVLRALHNGRQLVVVDHPEAVAMLIGAIALALPRQLSARLTFNTCIRDPRQADTLICGTTPDSEPLFATGAYQDQYYIFDFHRQRFSPAPQHGFFGDTLAHWYHEQLLERILGFRNFVDRTAPSSRAGDLDDLLNLYRMLSSESGDTATLISGIHFVFEKKLYLRAGVWQQLDALARQRGDRSLLLRWSGQEIAGRGAAKGQTAREILDQLKQLDGAGFSSGDYDEFFARGWPGGYLPAADALLLVRHHAATVFRSRVFLQMTLEGLRHEPAIVTPDSNIRALLAVLQRLEAVQRSAGGKSHPAAAAIAAVSPDLRRCSALARWGHDFPRAGTPDAELRGIEFALRELPPSNTMAIAAVLRLALQHFLSGRVWHGHYRAYLPALKQHVEPGLFWACLRELLHNAGRSRRISAAAWGRVFQFVYRERKQAPARSSGAPLPAEAPAGLREEIYQEELLRIYQAFDRAARNEIERSMTRDTRWLLPWREWKKRGSFLRQVADRWLRLRGQMA